MLAKYRFMQPFGYLAQNARFISTKQHKSDLILTKEVNNNGLLILNRPAALNAFNLEMMEVIGDVLKNWKDSKSLIMIRGSGDKAFCAGGDVSTIVQSKPQYAKDLSKIEYSTMHLIGNLKVPYVAFIDGITMGGGNGLAVHGKYRIATERTVFAMPEVKIGFYPDIGASYFLPRLPGKLGFYLGLTGSSMKGADVFHSGIATHFCDSGKMHALERILMQLDKPDDVDAVINDFCPRTQMDYKLAKNLERINECFDAGSVEEILAKLEKDGSEWAEKTFKALHDISPTSLKVTFRQLNLGENMSLGECLQMDYRMSYQFVKDSDFYEGVRALLIDKDKRPKWSPSRIQDVSEEMVSRFFQPLPNDEDLPIDVKLTLKI